MNESDSEKIATLLEQKGYRPAQEKQADLVIINMCSVRQSAVDRVYYKISKLKSKILITGCVLEKDKKRFQEMGARFKRFNLEKITPSYDGVTLPNGRVKPKTCFIPIMRGCNNFCSYCVVPYTRGREKFKPQKNIICEVEHLLKHGNKKIILLGQNVNSYPGFVKLLQDITKLKNNFKVSFLTNHPKDFSDALIHEIAKNKKISKEIHLPVQSGDNKILKAMNRKYTREQYLKLVEKIKSKIPKANLTTDVIVGFPGETKKAFENTL
ncbi:MAG: MiaB/RimO family radical SAM methylthiotransferase, partial [bacterium]